MIRRSVDHPTLCEADFGEQTGCGPPDGREDSVEVVAWRADPPRTVAELTPASQQPAFRSTFVWDGEGRLIRREDHHGLHLYEYTTGPLPILERHDSYLVTWRYDAAGRHIERIEMLGTKRTQRKTWTYGSDGRLTLMESCPAGMPCDRLTYAWQVDARGLPTRLVLTTSGGERREFERRYDERRLLVGRTDAGGSMVRIERADDGRVIRTGQADYRCLAHLWAELSR
jgi:YD repeat-containing protein